MVRNGFKLITESHCPITEPISKRTEHGVSYGLSEAGYDIRLKQDIVFQPEDITRQHRGHSTVIIDNVVKTGRFVIASVIEEFDMPTDLVGIVHDKSTWARRGLSVFNTVIEPGWKGWLTLELVYHGNEWLHIPAGSGIAQVIFHEITNSVRYEGKYQNQEDKPVESRFK